MDKERTPMERARRMTEPMSVLVIYFALIGTAILLFGLFNVISYSTLKDDRYLSNPDIKLNEMPNATWTYSRSDLNEKIADNVWIAAIGVSLMGGSIVAVLALPDRKELHPVLCHPEHTAPKYCSECGLKLSQLDKK